MIPLDKTIITREMIDAAADALANEPPLFGESIARFEEEFARYCGTDFAVSVNSGTDALTFTLMACGLKGKRAITTPCSYIATPNSAFHAGGEPVFCDVGKANNVSPAEIGKALKKNRKVRAIIPVHLHGYPAEMDEIMELAEKKDVFVLEDACQAHGASYRGKKVGSIGHAAAFSFNPMKNMTVGGDGGMVTTNDEKIAKFVRSVADSGRESPYTHEHRMMGYTSRLDGMRAAVGRVQLRHLDTWNGKRRRLASEYRKRLEGRFGLPLEEKDISPAYNKFAISAKDRDAIREMLYSKGIESDAHYPIPLHLQPPYAARGYKRGDYPAAERFADTTLSLPLYADMNEEEMDAVCAAL